MTQLLLGIAPDWIPTLDNFVSGRNVELLSVLRHALAAAQGERGLYIWGETGSGKSHLLQAAVGQARAAGLSAVYACGEVPDAAQVVAMDDVERLDDAAQIDLFALYNRMRENGGVLLVSGTQAPAFLSLRDDLRTRLGWGLVYQVHALNDTEKAQALHAACAGTRFRIAERSDDLSVAPRTPRLARLAGDAGCAGRTLPALEACRFCAVAEGSDAGRFGCVATLLQI